MIPKPFKLERYFAQYEFSAPYLLSPSDCESLSMNALLEMADPQTAQLWDGLSLGYTESQGHPLLREEISALYAEVGPEKVLVSAPEEGIYIAMHILLSPGDEVITIDPAYQSLYEVARMLNCQVIPWRIVREGSGWQLDLAELERLITGRTRLLVINFPHNPTGHLPSREDFQAIIDLARRSGIYIFSDEMYRLLEYEPGHRLPPAADLYERGVSLAGMSKALALPGLRIGWLASRIPGFTEACLAYKDYTTICSSAPSEILALIGLRARAQILARNLDIIRRNLAAAEVFFARHPDLFKWHPPQAGSVAFPRWAGPSTVEEFCQAAVERQGVMIVPGSIFDDPDGHFRLGLGRQNFAEALERVERLLSSQWLNERD